MRQEDKITEKSSLYHHLESKSVGELLEDINREDHKVADAVKKALPQIEALVVEAEKRMKRGGRVFYIGAGTSGRLGVLDASELPPTFGVPSTLVSGLIAGGDTALRNAVENAEDMTAQGWADLQKFEPNADDTLIGIAASGTTPYVIGAIREARAHHMLTGCITASVTQQKLYSFFSSPQAVSASLRSENTPKTAEPVPVITAPRAPWSSSCPRRL